MRSDWLDMVIPSKLGYRTTATATFDLCSTLIARDIPGDFAECGVYAGAELAMMAQAIMLSGSKKRVHAFDSFQGIPAPGPEDSEFITAGTPAGDACCPLDDVKRNMKRWGIPDDLIVWHQGWFADTVPLFDGKLALLRLDGDLYESTKVCMEHLYPRVSVGGWVIVDDYPLSGCRKALHETIYPQPIYFQVVV